MNSFEVQRNRDLSSLGLSLSDDLSFVEEYPDTYPGRVIASHGHTAEVSWSSETGLRTSLLHLSSNLNARPVAGDWVAVTRRTDGYTELTATPN